MAALFLDASAASKRYVKETGSLWITSQTDPASGNRTYLSSITRVELLAALQLRVRTGSLPATLAQQAELLFRHELATLFRSLPLTTLVLDDAMRLVLTHPLRAYDAVQLASAIELNKQRLARKRSGITFVCADLTLNRAAASEGLQVEDPNQHP